LNAWKDATVIGGATRSNCRAAANYTEIYGWQDVGKIESGRDADVLILNQDPRSDLSALDAIDRVILNGVPVNRDRLLSFNNSP